MNSLVRFLAIAALLSARLSFPQEKAVEQQPLQYEVTVSLKLIQVYVTDKDGRPVTDLNKEDFLVFEDGRPVAISDFEKHSVETVAAAREGAPAPSQKIDGMAPAPGNKISRKFILFFDFAYNNPRGLLKAKEAALHFLDSQIIPVDEVGVFSYSALKGLLVHEYLTADHERIRAVVDSIGVKALAGRAEDIEEEYWRQAGVANEAKHVPNSGFASPNPEADASRLESKKQAERYIDSLTGLARAMRYVAGQKEVVFFSTGIPSSLIFGHQAGRVAADPSGVLRRDSKFDPGDVDLRSRNEVMYQEFSTANCTLYSFDTREAAKIASGFNYDEQSMVTGYRDIFSEQGVHSEATTPFRDEKLTGRDALKRFSDNTGGKYYGNINEFQKSTAEVGSLTGAYYVLGHYVTEQLDGKFHELKVEVKRPDCRVRAQAGYFSPKPFREYSSLEKQLHLFDLALNGRSSFGAPIAVPMMPLSNPVWQGRIQLLTAIPDGVMARLSAGKLEFSSVVFDSRNDIISFQRAQASLPGYTKTDVVVTSGADLKPGRYKCRTIVRNLDTGMTGLSSCMLDVPENTSGGPVTPGSPLLLQRSAAPLYISTEPVPQRDSPAWKEVYRFDQARLAPVIGEVQQGSSMIYALVPFSFKEAANAEPSWSAYLVRPDSEERIPISTAFLTSFEAGGIQVQLLELSIEALSPGSYELFFKAEGTGGAEPLEVHTPLKVRA